MLGGSVDCYPDLPVLGMVLVNCQKQNDAVERSWQGKSKCQLLLQLFNQHQQSNFNKTWLEMPFAVLQLARLVGTDLCAWDFQNHVLGGTEVTSHSVWICYGLQVGLITRDWGKLSWLIQVTTQGSVIYAQSILNGKVQVSLLFCKLLCLFHWLPLVRR